MQDTNNTYTSNIDNDRTKDLIQPDQMPNQQYDNQIHNNYPQNDPNQNKPNSYNPDINPKVPFNETNQVHITVNSNQDFSNMKNLPQNPINIRCLGCKQNVTTRVNEKAVTDVDGCSICLIICLFTPILPFALCSLLSRLFSQDKFIMKHYCTNCGSNIGESRKINRNLYGKNIQLTH